MSLPDPNASAALQLYEQQPEIFKKPVQAIHIAISGGIQSKTQRLAFNAMLKHALDQHARNPGTDIDTYSISRTELMRIIDYTSPNRKHLKAALLQMQKLTVQWDFLQQDGGGTWASCVLLPFVAFDNDRVYYSYASQIKPLLFNSKIYALLDLRIQRLMRLDPSAALYEWVTRFRNNPSKRTNEMTWQEWRTVIYGEVSETSALHEYKIFKREKLKPAIAEINSKSDLQITMLENKNGGRSVQTLQFVVETKQIFELQDAGRDTARLEKRLAEAGVSVREIKRMLAAYAPEKVEVYLELTLKRAADTTQTALKSKAAYLKRALEANFLPETAAAPAPAAQKPAEDSLRTIQEAFARARADEAAAMFAEMAPEERKALVDEYNGEQTIEGMCVPDAVDKRTARVMIPFYGWLARRTWGEAPAEEIFTFALKQGLLKVGDLDL